MILKIVTFTPEHVDLWDRTSLYGDLIAQVVLTRDFDMTRSCFHPKLGLVGFGGLDRLWTSTKNRDLMEAWVELQPKVLKQLTREERVELFWKIRREMKSMIRDRPICRIQSLVDSGFDVGNRFARLTGLRLEHERLENMSVDEGCSNLYSMVF